MIRLTHSHNAPWTVIRSDDKHKARLEVLKVILNSLDYDGRDGSLEYALDPDIVISGDREIEIMDAQRTSCGKFIS